LYHIKLSLNLPFILLIINLLWVWNHYWVWRSSVEMLISWANSEILVKPMTDIASENFEKLGFGPLEVISLFIKKYGHIFIYLFLSAMVIVTKPLKYEEDKDKYLFQYFFVFSIISLIWLTDYVRPLTAFTSGRLITCVIPMFPLLVAITLNYFCNLKTTLCKFQKMHPLALFKIPSFASVAVYLILSFCFINAAFSYYPSPYIYASNEAISVSKKSGLEWAIQNINVSKEIVGVGIPRISRVIDSIYGTHQIYPNWNETVNDHFGYSLNNSMLGNYENNTYIITDEKYILFVYEHLFPEISRFERDDFMTLNNDQSVKLIYNNDVIKTWSVSKTP